MANDIRYPTMPPRLFAEPEQRQRQRVDQVINGRLQLPRFALSGSAVGDVGQRDEHPGRGAAIIVERLDGQVAIHGRTVGGAYLDLSGYR
ncbi:hypothetical protein FQZ97_769790 [compost metagenome]